MKKIFKWEKKGLIIKPDPRFWWMQSYAMVPTAQALGGDEFRIFFSGRDSENRSIISSVHTRFRDGKIEVLCYDTEPVLTLGELGCFDDNGVTPSCVLTYKKKTYLYYIGWNAGSTTRMSLIAGLAISLDGGKTFQRNSRAPLLERTHREPFSVMTAPYVLKEGKKWRLWYVSGEKWENRDLPLYNIKYAESVDGIHWKREGLVCIDFKDNQEKALARPYVLKNKDNYEMWFSYKDPQIGYRIGFAESLDGSNWERQDHRSGIDASQEGWDSEMIEYACVVQHKGHRYMLYNGNHYGKDGIGYAISHISNEANL